MPLPFILGAAAAAAGLAGVGTSIHGAAKMKEANDTMKSADSRHKRNLARFEEQNKTTAADMDMLGTLELNILNSFKDFADVFERIQNRPEFKEYQKNGIEIPRYDGEELRKVSVGAGVLLGGITGAALGTAGGFAAAGATTSAVMALGTASTGTAIASLSGIAATNATLAALGGGAIAAGGGGMALGTTILGATTLGAGLLVGGMIFNLVGSSLSNKADEAWSQMMRAEKKIDCVCAYMQELSSTAEKYGDSLRSVKYIYDRQLKRLKYIVYDMGKTNWLEFSASEQKCTENVVLLVGLLYNMCKVRIVLQAEQEGEMNQIDTEAVNRSMKRAEEVLYSNGF